MTGVARAAQAVAQRLSGRRPAVAIVLGSGLGFLADEVQGGQRIRYADIPGFPEPGVAGHKGELVVGLLEKVPVLVQAAARKEFWRAFVSIPSFFVLRVVNCVFVLEAIWSEWIVRRSLLVYEKGH